MKVIKFLLYVFLNILAGLLILVFMLLAGFIGSGIYAFSVNPILRLIGTIVLIGGVLILLFFTFLSFSKEASKRYPKFFWLFGICYILLPVFFAIAGSENSESGTIRMRLVWFGVSLLIYIASIIGGLKGRQLE